MVALPATALARPESVRLFVHSTTRAGAVVVHNGGSAVLGRAPVRLELESNGQGATFTLTRADTNSQETLGVPSFLSTGGTWMVPGAWVGSSASTVALAVYPEGPGAGKAHARNTGGDYARIVMFSEKHSRKTGTVTKLSAPLRVGQTTFGVTQFFSSHSCQLSVSGPQFRPSKLFGIITGGSGNVIASRNGKQAFVVIASSFHR